MRHHHVVDGPEDVGPELVKEPVDGARAAEIGLAWSCHPDAELLDAARTLATVTSTKVGEGKKSEKSLEVGASIGVALHAISAHLVHALRPQPHVGHHRNAR